MRMMNLGGSKETVKFEDACKDFVNAMQKLEAVGPVRFYIEGQETSLSYKDVFFDNKEGFVGIELETKLATAEQQAALQAFLRSM